MGIPKTWILWNLFLATVPVILGYTIALGAERLTVTQKRAPWWVWLPLALVWFAFLPNTCYLLTEWRHFLFDSHFVSLRDDVSSNQLLMLTVARQGLCFFIYSGLGALCFALSIRPIHRLLRKTRFLPGVAVPFYFLISLGVYMGLIIRLNSWDILSRPAYVLQVALRVFTVPLLFKTVVVFAVLLWVLYIIVDMWIDGVKLRLSHAETMLGKPGAGT